MAKPPRFHTRPFPRRRKRSWWRSLRPFLWLGLVLAVAAGINRLRGDSWISAAEWQEVHGSFTLCGRGRSANCVIDGDTVMLGNRKVRLRDFNAPELNGTCRAERQLALRARQGLLDWLNRADLLMDGGAEPPFDQYGRELRTAKRIDAGGRTDWLSEHMIAAGLAQSTGWDAPRGGWC